MKKKTILLMSLGCIIVLGMILSSCWLFEFDVPESSLKTPANGANINTSTTPEIYFSWSNEEDNLSYDFYLGKDKNNLPKFASNLKTKTYTIRSNQLERDVSYHWKVVAKRDNDKESTSAIRSFKILPSNSNYKALVIGVSDYSGSGHVNLKMADYDASDVKNVLGYLKQDYEVEKLSGKVLSSTVEAKLQEYASTSNNDSVFLFYFSGHGGYDTTNGSYITFADGIRMNVSKLKTFLDNINGIKIVVIEAVKSGDFINMMQARQFNDYLIKEFFGDDHRSRNDLKYYVITGAKINQDVWDDDNLMNAVFTFFLCDGLGDTGLDKPLGPFNYTYNADTNNDKKITFKEITNYTSTNVFNYLKDNYGLTQEVQYAPIDSEYVIGEY